MTLEILLHFLQLDVPWLVLLIVNNPHWLFIFAAFFVFAYHKKGFGGFIMMLMFFFPAVALAQIFGIMLFAIAFPVQYLATSIFLDSFPEKTFVKKHLGIINILLLFGVGFAFA